MSVSPATFGPDPMRAEKRAVAQNSVLAAIAITVLKIIVGISTGSLGILSEAAHSLLDLAHAIIPLRQARGRRQQVRPGKVGDLPRLLGEGPALAHLLLDLVESRKAPLLSPRGD